MLNIVTVSFSFVRGGAGIAASRFKALLNENPSISLSIDISQDGIKGVQYTKRIASYVLNKLQYDGNPIKHSLNLFSFRPLLEMFKGKPEFVYHFHWINNDTLSVFDFNKIPSGSIITLHDEWLYCGAEHCYKVSELAFDFEKKYSFFKKGVYGIHWNYIIWRIKKYKLSHRRDLIYTVPSQWALHRAKSSTILKNSDIRYLPNPIDTEVFNLASDSDMKIFRSEYFIKDSDIVFAYCALDGSNNFYKGRHLLDEAVQILHRYISPDIIEKIRFIEFGDEISETNFDGFNRTSVGHINSSEKLSLLFASVDCVLVPSMVESFGQVAAEALACGTPVLCFNSSGLKDINIHEKTGLLAEAFSSESFALNMFKIILMTPEKRKLLGRNGRNHIQSKFSHNAIRKQYIKIIEDAVELKKKNNGFVN